MRESYGPFNWLARLSLISLIVSLAALLITLAMTVAHAIITFGKAQDALALGWCVVAAILQIALGLGLVTAYGAIIARISTYMAMGTLNGHMNRLESVMQASQDSLRRLTDLESLSDQAKAMIYRDKELEAAQEIVNACLVRQDYEQAEKLISRMESQFGYHSEAERLRAAVAASKEASTEQQIAAAVGRVQQIIEQKNWARALREAQRLAEVYGEHERVKELPSLIGDAQNRHKRQLLQQYDEAVTRDDIDRSIELLKELDRYLTPQEGAALQESARGVFRKKLHNLGVQFAIAVNDDRWDEAVRTGEEIIRAFPNSRMAMEVKQKLSTLRQLGETSLPS